MSIIERIYILRHAIKYVCGYIMKTVQQNYKKPRRIMMDSLSKQEFLPLQLHTRLRLKKETANENFKMLLLEAIDESLASLGDSAKQAIYFYLERNFQIKKQDIPDKVDEFVAAIEKIFGEGAKILEIQIMKWLNEKAHGSFEYYPKNDELKFTKYIQAFITFQDT